jgi:hypothetical protein
MSDSTATAPSSSPGNVIVSAERLAELERLAQLALKKKEKDLSKLAILKSKDTPEKSKQRVMKHYELHKDEINAKRREKRRLAREAKEMAEKSETPGVGETTGR